MFKLQLKSLHKKIKGRKLENPQIAINLPLEEIRHPFFLITTIISAIIAQFLIINHMITAGIVTYMLCAIGFFVWMRLNSTSSNTFINQPYINQAGRNMLLGTVIVLTIFTRFFDLNTRVYGLSPDETKWTMQSWDSKILHVDTTEFPTKHYKYQPVDFWVKSFFLRIFGINFISARIESAVLSLFAVACLYLLIKLITSSAPIGLISALVFSLSFIELNASHQALHNTPPLTWMLASFVLFFIALRDRRLWQFQATGILISLGMLTYDTFYPSFAVIFLYFSAISIQEIKKGQVSIKSCSINLAAITWPVILVYFIFIKDYQDYNRQTYLFGLLQHAIAKNEYFSLIQFFEKNIRDVFETTFSRVLWTDALINWNGPLLNPLVLPFVVIGFAYNLKNIRQAHFFFIPLMYGVHVVSGCILLGATWPRVMYLETPALMGWAGLGLWITLAALMGVFKNQQRYVPISIFIFILASIIINDNIIFRYKLIDMDDHQKRRELSDITIAAAKRTTLLLYPYMLNQKDFIELDSRIITYSLAGEKNAETDVNSYFELINMKQLLQSLWLNKDKGEIGLIFDKTAPTLTDEREKIIHLMLSCYPEAQLSYEGEFFDMYHFGKQTLKHPKCYAPKAPANISPRGEISTKKTLSLTFNWDMGEISGNDYIFNLEKRRSDILWVEVEQYFIGEGWIKESTAVSGYSGEGYLVDSGENLTGEALYTINIEKPGNYYIWFRTYKRRNNDQNNFVLFQETKTEIAKTGQNLNQWIWESIGVHNLPLGASPIALIREYGNDEQYSTFIDTMVITPDATFQPSTEDKIWDNVFTLVKKNSGDNFLVLPKTLSTGLYRWNIRILSLENIVDSNGNPWIESDLSTFYVTE